MARKGMLSLFSSSTSRHRSRPSTETLSSHRPNFSATLMEENIATAEKIVTQWDPTKSNSKVTYLFSDAGRDEARRFLRSVDDLQRAMVFFSSSDCLEPSAVKSHALIRAQTLMQSAIRRLEKEFYQILSSNRDRLDPESVSSSLRSPRSSVSDLDSEDEIRAAGDSIDDVERASAVAMADLRSIAQTMIAAGYGKECVKIYKILRKSIVDEGLYRLGFENLTVNQIQKLDWEVLDLKIRSWLAASGVAVRTLFSGERMLCDHVFEGSDSIRESCFADITKEAAIQFLGFAETLAKSKRSPEKLFRFLDLYNAIAELWLDIEYVFSFDSTAAVRSQALSSFLKLADAARSTLAEFESAIQKDSSKTPTPGGGVHPLTRYAMNYIVFLADYESALADIYADFPLQIPSPLPDSIFDSSSIQSAPSSPSSFEGTTRSSLSPRIAWLILVLLCKLNAKAEVYREVALSYLFLCNNLQYMVNKVKESSLGVLLGEEWTAKHAAKARHYEASYERLGWSRVATVASPAAPPRTAEEAEEGMREFNAVFEEAVRVQREWVVADGRMREEVRASVAGMIVPAYRAFYQTYRPLLSAGSGEVSAVRFAPEDVRDRVMELFGGPDGSGSSGSSLGSIMSASGRSGR